MFLQFTKRTQVSYSALKIWAVALLIALLTLIIYLPALKNDFVNWDDDKYVYENPYIRSLDLQFLKWIFGFNVLNWHPLTWLSYSIDYALWGLHPMGYHLTNILFHSANTFLVFFFILHLFKNTRMSESHPPPTETSYVVAASIAALLFGIHPLHVESVAWISERKDMLSMFFVLLSLISYIKYVRPWKRDTQTIHYVFCLIFFTLAIMSKPIAVTVPGILILLDIYPFQRIKAKGIFTEYRKAVIDKIPFFVLSLATIVLTILAQRSGNAIVSLESYPMLLRIISAVQGLSFYLFKMLLPIGLSPFYPLQKNISLLSFDFVFLLTLPVAVTIFCIYAWKKNCRVFTIIWAYYVITLLPVIGIIQIGEQAAADRYFYMSSLGPFFLLGLGTSLAFKKYYKQHWKSRKGPIVILLLLISIILSLNIITVKQIRVWNNSITLWSHVLENYPDFWLPYYNRAHMYTNMGEYQQALDDVQKAIRLKPLFFNAYFIRAIIYIHLGKLKEATQDLDTYVELNPDKASAYNKRGISYLALGKPKEAIIDFSYAITQNPRYAVYYYNRARAYLKLDKISEATRDFQTAAMLGSSEAKEFLSGQLLMLSN